MKTTLKNCRAMARIRLARVIITLLVILSGSVIAFTPSTFADLPSSGGSGPTSGSSIKPKLTLDSTTGKYTCGGGPVIQTAINIGCKGEGNPIMDMIFAFIRFLSMGVGLVIVGSMIVAGIQYTSSRGDPQATAAAENRIRSNVIALLLFIFAYAILNYILPGQFLK